MTKIRLDFKSVTTQLERLQVYSEHANTFNNKDWVHYKTKEDYNNIFALDMQLRRTYEEIYAVGKSCAYWIATHLSSFNDVQSYPTLKSYIESFNGTWVYQTTTLKSQTKAAKNLIEKHGSPWAIKEMVNLFDSEIAMLEALQIVIDELKDSDLYKRESKSRNSNTSPLTSRV